MNLLCNYKKLLITRFFLFIDITADQVTAYLKANPEFLEHHIMDEVELEQLERWMIRRTQRARKQTLPIGKNGRKTSLSRFARPFIFLFI